jgi:hypothetical protein
MIGGSGEVLHALMANADSSRPHRFRQDLGYKPLHKQVVEARIGEAGEQQDGRG